MTYFFRALRAREIFLLLLILPLEIKQFEPIDTQNFLRAKRADFFDVIGAEGPKKFAGFGSNLTKILCEIRISLNTR